MFFTSAHAQIIQHNYLDFSSNALINGISLRAANLTAYQFGTFEAEGGLLVNLTQQFDRTLAALRIKGRYQIKTKKNELFAHTAFLYHPVSNLINEKNYCLWLEYRIPHFNFQFGNNSRIYSLTDEAMNLNALTEDDDYKIKELRNFMYRFEYSLKPQDHPWNSIFAITNTDYFLIQQETNPMLMAGFRYEISKKLRAYCELSYVCAGSFNLQANRFGYTFKTGLIWQAAK